MKRWIAMALAGLALFSTQVSAEAGIRDEAVHFQKGSTQATLKGRIKGYETIDFHLGAKAGQTMEVVFKPSNLSAYFNVLPAGEEEALFVGSSSGNQFSGVLPKDGDYRVRVYLMRNAARRNESSSYSITFRISGG